MSELIRAFPDWASVLVAGVAATVFIVILWLHWEDKWEREEADRLWDDELEAAFHDVDVRVAASLEGMLGNGAGRRYLHEVSR